MSVQSKCHRTGFRKNVNHGRSPTFAIDSRRLVDYIHRGLGSPLRNNCFCWNLLFMAAWNCVCVSERKRPCPCFTCMIKIKINFDRILIAIGSLFCRAEQTQKCPTGNKSTLELACLTRFQPRLSCLFIVIGLTMSLRCGFE